MFPAIDKKRTGENLRRIMENRGITVKEVQEYLGLGSVQSVYHWLNGISMPTIDNLYALSELFKMPIDKIVCGNRTWQTPDFDLEYYDDKARLGRLYLYCSKLIGNSVA